MKWYSFKEKLPELGANILVSFHVEHANENYIAMTNFDVESRRCIMEYLEEEGWIVGGDCYFYTDSSVRIFPISRSEFWAYPSTAKLSKLKV